MNLSEYIDSIKNKCICVIGTGVSNKPLIKLLSCFGCNVTVCDRQSLEELGSYAFELLNSNVKLRLGPGYLDNLNYDVIFRTPGLMPFDPHLVNARNNGSLITSEMEVFLSLCPCPVIAVTGSDGKTTTTTIIANILKQSGYKVHVGGNIGKPLLCDLPYMEKEDICVVELSSFQLHSMYCSPKVAVVTNISPNHLDKHIDYDDYISAKKQIFRNQSENSVLVLNYDNEITAGFAEEVVAHVQYFSDQTMVTDGFSSIGGKIYSVHDGVSEFVMNEDEIAIPGRHNVQNYLAAFSAVSGFSDLETCRYIARTFKGVEHRLEFVRELDGVVYINDSIGTSPSRTEAGLRSVKTKPILIAGGYDKHIPFDELADSICRYAKELILTGDTAEALETAVKSSPLFVQSDLNVSITGNLGDAVNLARSHAESGDIVLLSPACAAFDRYKNFEVRGNAFKKMVMELK